MVEGTVRIKKSENGGYIISCTEKMEKKTDGKGQMVMMQDMKEVDYTAKDFDEAMGIIKDKFEGKEESKNKDKEEGETKPKDDTADWMKKRKKEVKEK